MLVHMHMYSQHTHTRVYMYMCVTKKITCACNYVITYNCSLLPAIFPLDLKNGKLLYTLEINYLWL